MGKEQRKVFHEDLRVVGEELRTQPRTSPGPIRPSLHYTSTLAHPFFASLEPDSWMFALTGLGMGADRDPETASPNSGSQRRRLPPSHRRQAAVLACHRLDSAMSDRRLVSHLPDNGFETLFFGILKHGNATPPKGGPNGRTQPSSFPQPGGPFRALFLWPATRLLAALGLGVHARGTAGYGGCQDWVQEGVLGAFLGFRVARFPPIRSRW